MKCKITISHQGEVLTPQLLVARALSSQPLSLNFSNANNEHIELDFRYNRDLLHPNLQDSPSTSSLVSFCHLNAELHGLQSAVSLCHPDHITGLIVTEHNTFILDIADDQFFLLPQTTKSCGFSSRNKRDVRSGRSRVPSYYSKINDGKIRYVELALVADNSMYVKYKEDEAILNDRLQSIAHLVNALYFHLNVRITLVWVEIWKDGDKFTVEDSGDKTLDMFLNYRKTFIKEHPNDNAHMLTNIRFEAGVVGKAFKGTMCSYDYSGGVDVDHSANAAAVAATIAHEMGHNFGMEHDVDYGTTCTCPGSHCIMAPSTGSSPPSFWSDCSLRYLGNSFKRGVDLCLQNQPEQPVGDAKCGNGVVEAGEECDCGQEVCLNNCCDGKTCQLIGEAICASGDCCDLKTCKPKQRATVCRRSTNVCDLEEYCNGETADCPADFFVQDGHVCPGRSEGEFCYQGECGSRSDQCTSIWGEPSVPAVKQCFQQNTLGIIQGNCGFDVHTQKYFPCAKDDVMCGRLHCETKVERPIFGDASTVTPAYTYIRMGEETHQCHVIKTTYVGGKNTQRDPGMVLDGSSCGADKVCVDAKCRFRKDVNKTVSQCNDHCKFRGICNNVGNCHCENGFGGIACEIPGYGGSVNSNTANYSRGLTPSLMFLVLFGIFSVVFVLACIYYRIKRKRNIPLELWHWSKKTLNLHGVLVPVRKAPPPPRLARKRESLSAMWGDATVTYSTNDQPPRILPPAIPLMTVSPSTSPIAYSHIPSKTDVKPTKPLNRVPSVRPRNPPPAVPTRPKEEIIEKLYEEEGLNRPCPPNKPLPALPPEDPFPSAQMTKGQEGEGVARPAQPPPPPPKFGKPKLSNRAAEPPIPIPPVGPVVLEENRQKLNVKKMAAIFDAQKEKK